MIRRPDMDIQFKILIVSHHLMLLSLFFIDWSWHWLLLSLVGWILFGKIGGEIGFHRLTAHKSFETTRLKKIFLIIMGSLTCLGSSYGWAGTHRIHHRYSDTTKDPQSPMHLKWYDVWLVNWKPVKFSPSLVKDLLDDPLHARLHKNYLEFVLFTYLLLALIDFRIPLFLISVSSVWTFHTSSIFIDIVCHKWGYRNFETTDNSKNNTWVNIILLGSGGLHNNHHSHSHLPTTNMKPGEIDTMGWLIKNYFEDKK